MEKDTQHLAIGFPGKNDIPEKILKM